MRSNKAKYGVFVGDESLSRLLESKKFYLGDFMHLLFPRDRNHRQFEVACWFMEHLLENGIIESEEFKKIMDHGTYSNLLNIVLPKLERFGLVKVRGPKGRGRGKPYTVELDKKFYVWVHQLGMEWLRIYTRNIDD